MNPNELELDTRAGQPSDKRSQTASEVRDELKMGYSGKTCLVHKQNEEGAIAIDAITGRVLGGWQDADRPQWSEGLAVAVLSERSTYYTRALGADVFTGEMKSPVAFAFEDLAWVGVDPESGDELSLDASTEFRQKIVSTFMGEHIDPVTGDISGEHETLELDTARHRSAEEIAALEETQKQGAHAFKTGTEG